MLLESLRLRQLKIIRKFHAFCLNMSRRLLLASGGVSPCQQRLSFSCWSLAYLRKTLPESSEIFVEHTPQGATILDKNVKKNTPGMFHFRILHSKDPYTQDTFPSPPPKKTMLKGHRNISGPDLTTLIGEGWGEGPP